MAITTVSGTPVTATSTAGSTADAVIPGSTWLANDVIVALVTTNNNTVDVNTVTNVSSTLTFTRRANNTPSGNGYVGIYTAVAGSDQSASAETIRLTDDDGSGGGRSITVYVLRGADPAQAFNLVNVPASAGTTWGASLTGQANSWYGITGQSNAASTSTPNGATTEDADNSLGASTGNTQGHNASAGTSQSLGGTYSAGTVSWAAIIEVLAAAGAGITVTDSALASDVTGVASYFPYTSWFQGDGFQNDAFAFLGGTTGGGGLGLSAIQSDSALASDVWTLLLNPKFGPQTDTALASDSFGLGIVKNAAESDTAQASDSLGVGITKNVAQSDTALASDTLDVALGAGAGFSASMSDSVQASDTLGLGIVKSVAQTDSAQASDTLGVAVQKVVAQTDTALASDSTGVAKSAAQTTTDTAQASDSIGLALAKSTAQTDTALASDAFGVALASAGAIAVSFSDAVQAGDIEAVKVLKNVAQSDSAVALDSFAFALGSTSKTGTVSDKAVASDAFGVAGGTPLIPTFSIVNIWNGSAWVRWNGSGWV